MKIGAIIPVKKFIDSKNRLSSMFTVEEKKELVRCMLFDVCDVLIKSSYLNGVVLPIDGGFMGGGVIKRRANPTYS